MGFDLSAFPELESALGRAADVLSGLSGSGAAQDKIKKSLKTLVSEARGNVNTRTGNLRRGIDCRVKISPVKEDIAEAGVSYSRKKKAHHAHLVENGHMNFNQYGGPFGKTPPHPFWEPALKAKKEDVLSTLSGECSEVIGRRFKL